MAIKFTVEREGQSGDNGPNGEYGVVIVGRDGDFNTGFTGHCPTAHEHSKACAQAILDNAGRAAITAVINAQKAAVAAQPVHAKAPYPKKDKTVTEDGKSKVVQVDDTDLV